MTHPQEPPGPATGAGVPEPAGAPEPAPEVVEWGAGPPRAGLLRLAGWRWWRPPAAWPLAGLGAVALFASTIGDWQLTTRGFSRPSVIDDAFVIEESREVGVGLDLVGAWGLVWLIGATGLAICVWLTLFGLTPVRAYTRSIGLATAGVLLGLLVAAAVSLSTDLTEPVDLTFAVAEQRRLGWGPLAAFASVLLLGAALRQARVPAGPGSGPAPGPGSILGSGRQPTSSPQTSVPAYHRGLAFSGPPDLAVGPAEPFARPDDDRRWR